jgi:hypothetical protein
VSNGFELSDDDVIHADNFAAFDVGSTFKTSQLREALKEYVQADHPVTSPRTQWFVGQGLKCQVLRTHGRGWRQGRVRFRLEFIPDKPDPLDDIEMALAELQLKLNLK